MVARDNLVAGIPPVKVLNRIGVQIPVAVVRVPVSVHGPDYVRCAICTTAP